MGKKSDKKSFYKKSVKPFVKGNRVLLAALTGVAAGLTLSSLMGTEKAKRLLHTIEGSVQDFTSKITDNGRPADNHKKKVKAAADLSTAGAS